MRIGKITLDGYYNYGNLLQNYALQQVLLKYADEVETIWHTKDNFLPQLYWHSLWKQFIKYLNNWKNFRYDFQSGHIGREMVRQGKLRDWAERYICFRKGVENLMSISTEYDYFVTGSDQVWNHGFCDNIYLKNNFLLFAPQEKRISYAASISTPYIPPDKIKIYEEGFKGMRALSLREQAGAELVKQISQRKANVHIDPTLLLTTEEWDKVSRVPAWYHGKDYILTYFLGDRPDDVIQRVAKEANLSIVNLLDDKVYEHYVTGVDEFIWAIKHASLVYTDSFHATVFSILYHTPFLVCDRLGNPITEKMGSRIDTLLKLFKLENRRGTIENGYEIQNVMNSPDWSNISDIINTEKKRSEEYLMTSLGLKILNKSNI